MFETFTVVIPHLPDKELSPNAAVKHGHWSQRSEPRKQARAEAKQEARSQLGPVPPVVAGRTIRLQVYALTTKATGLDADNAVASIKSYIDGIFDYLDTDDRHIDMICLQTRRNQPQDRMIFVFMDAEGFYDGGELP